MYGLLIWNSRGLFELSLPGADAGQSLSFKQGELRPRPAMRQGILHGSARDSSSAVIEYAVTGLLAWWRGQSGQVGNEAATAVFRQCRGLGSSPPSYLLSRSSRLPPVFLAVSWCMVRPSYRLSMLIRRDAAPTLGLSPGQGSLLAAGPVLWVNRPYVTDTILQ